MIRDVVIEVVRVKILSKYGIPGCAQIRAALQVAGSQPGHQNYFEVEDLLKEAPERGEPANKPTKNRAPTAAPRDVPASA